MVTFHFYVSLQEGSNWAKTLLTTEHQWTKPSSEKMGKVGNKPRWVHPSDSQLVNVSRGGLVHMQKVNIAPT